MKVEQLKTLIRGMVREALMEEVKPVVKEVLGEMLLEQIAVNGNSHKARALREASFIDKAELDEYPAMDAKRPAMDRGQMASILGYGEYTQGQTKSSEIVIDKVVSEHGVEHRIDPNSISPELKQVFNRDYRELMKALEKKKQHG